MSNKHMESDWLFETRDSSPGLSPWTNSNFQICHLAAMRMSGSYSGSIEKFAGSIVVAASSPVDWWDQIYVVKAGFLKPSIKFQSNCYPTFAVGKLFAHRIGDVAE